MSTNDQGDAMWIVVATEDDYYPDVQTIGVFLTEDDANTYAARQPHHVYPWHDSENEHLRTLSRYYDYTVERVVRSPVGAWRPEAP